MATMDLVAEIGFDQSFSFIYSRRPGTPAASLPDEVPHEVKQRRLELLQQRLERARDARYRKADGRQSAAGARRTSVEAQRRAAGRTHGQQPVGELRRSSTTGRTRSSTSSPTSIITEAMPNSLRGRLLRRPTINSAPAGAAPVAREVLLAPADNARLVELCGPLDEHLHLIESRLGVEVRRRGNRFQLMGASRLPSIARSRCCRVCMRARKSEPVDSERVHMALQELDMNRCGHGRGSKRDRRR